MKNVTFCKKNQLKRSILRQSRANLVFCRNCTFNNSFKNPTFDCHYEITRDRKCTGILVSEKKKLSVRSSRLEEIHLQLRQKRPFQRILMIYFFRYRTFDAQIFFSTVYVLKDFSSVIVPQFIYFLLFFKKITEKAVKAVSESLIYDHFRSRRAFLVSIIGIYGKKQIQQCIRRIFRECTTWI